MRHLLWPDRVQTMDASGELPSGYRLRAPKVDDASDIDHLSAVSDSALGAPPLLTEDLLRSLTSRSSDV